MNLVKYRDRKNTNSVKWDNLKNIFGQKDLLPLWVADMDFEVPGCVKKALHKYVEEGVFGYSLPDRGYAKAFIDWEYKYHGYKVDKKWIRFAPGVVPAISWIINALTKEGDPVIITPPVYYPFKQVVTSNKRALVESHLINKDGYYRIDFEDFEEKILDQGVKLFILCSPHNPVGRVWDRDELVRLLDICKRNGVYVIADEIHQDIIIGDKVQYPAASLGDYSKILVTLTAATKTFNLAACQNSFVIIEDEDLRSKYDVFTEKIRSGSGNAFGYIAVQAAYEAGRDWLEEVLGLIRSNYSLLKEVLELRLPEARLTPLEGTYLAWLDLGAYLGPDDIEDTIKNKCGLAVDFGSWFGGQKYASFIRINLATSRENIEILLDRLALIGEDK